MGAYTIPPRTSAPLRSFFLSSFAAARMCVPAAPRWPDHASRLNNPGLPTAVVVDPATDIPASGTCAAARSLAVAANSVVILLLLPAGVNWYGPDGSLDHRASDPRCGEEGVSNV